MKSITWITLLLLAIAGGIALDAVTGLDGSGWRMKIHDLYKIVSAFALGTALGRFGIK